MKTSILRFPALALSFTVGLLLAGSVSLTGARADDEIDFSTHVVPLFQKHCIRCHAPGNAKGDFSLATAQDLRANDYVIAGDPENSYLMELVAGVDGDPPEMPQDADPLSADELERLREWIRQGATWPDDITVREKPKADASWWAFQPLRSLDRDSDRETLDSGTLDSGTEQIDDFVLDKLAEQGLKLNPVADRRSLIRRATYDLLGLPPSPEEVKAFVNDPDRLAYEKLIDRLLDSPHYGERWGRHWLDVVRFGESNGFERNVLINELWPFRDYVIRSLNEDKPMDQFIREHLAGDVVGKDDPDVAVGTAFLVAGPYDDVNNQDAVQAAQIRANTLDEMIRATSEAFLGVTLGCARCHDHKFDPLTQEDYYGLYATLAGVRHGAVPLSTRKAREDRSEKLKPLNAEKVELEKQISVLDAGVLERAKSKLEEYKASWPRDSVDRMGTEDRFDSVSARFVRLVCEAQDGNPKSTSGFRIDEFEVWSAAEESRNVALASEGGKASGKARLIEDFPGAYGAHLTIDGKTGARFIATGNDLTIELAEPTLINRVVFSSALDESTPEHKKFVFVAEYRIEVSQDGKDWVVVASGKDRKPIENAAFLDHRLMGLETTKEDRSKRELLSKRLAKVNRDIRQVPQLPKVWIGRRVDEDAKGPFHVFLGGSPQKTGDVVLPGTIAVLDASVNGKQIDPISKGKGANAPVDSDKGASPSYPPESQRRVTLADWIVHPANPLPPRVLANRLWHYHFGTGIVDTPSDFGYMGGRPSHPELLDFLAGKLQQNGWRLKAMHRMIMLTKTYQQSSAHRPEAAMIDADARLLWRFPPRRLSAEEVRDTILSVAGKLKLQSKDVSSSVGKNGTHLVPDGGPGFRLYHFMQDNVSTYVPLDQHGPETYRRAVYHQNARSSVVDLMTEFDQPDCSFSAPRRAETTTPLQALTMLNHRFTIDMAAALAERVRQVSGEDVNEQIASVYEICYARQPHADEAVGCQELVKQHGLEALCRVLLNTSELIYLQ